MEVAPGHDVMAGQGVFGIALADQAGVGGEVALAMMNAHFGGILVHRHRLADEALGHGVAIGVERGEAGHVDDAFEDLVDRWAVLGQRYEVRLLEHVGGPSGRMPSTRLGLALAVSMHQVSAWALKSSQSEKLRPARKLPSM